MSRRGEVERAVAGVLVDRCLEVVEAGRGRDADLHFAFDSRVGAAGERGCAEGRMRARLRGDESVAGGASVQSHEQLGRIRVRGRFDLRVRGCALVIRVRSPGVVDRGLEIVQGHRGGDADQHLAFRGRQGRLESVGLVSDGDGVAVRRGRGVRCQRPGGFHEILQGVGLVAQRDRLAVRRRGSVAGQRDRRVRVAAGGRLIRHHRRAVGQH